MVAQKSGWATRNQGLLVTNTHSERSLRSVALRQVSVRLVSPNSHSGTCGEGKDCQTGRSMHVVRVVWVVQFMQPPQRERRSWSFSRQQTGRHGRLPIHSYQLDTVSVQIGGSGTMDACVYFCCSHARLSLATNWLEREPWLLSTRPPARPPDIMCGLGTFAITASRIPNTINYSGHSGLPGKGG